MRKLLCLLLILSVSLVFADHTVDLSGSNTIPCYCQTDPDWCGAAVTQMILEGYKDGKNFIYDQETIFNKIRSHNVEPDLWASDPVGIRETLMELGSYPGVYWAIFESPDVHKLLYDMSYWMTKTRMPVALNVWDGFHWVTCVKMTMDGDPRTSNSVRLKSIQLYDPMRTEEPFCTEPQIGGISVFLLANQFLADYLSGPVSMEGSRWKGKYVAVIDPPPKRGTIKNRANPGGSGGRKKISIGYAKYWAKYYLKKLKREHVVTSEIDRLFNMVVQEPLYVENQQVKNSVTRVKDEYWSYFLCPLGQTANSDAEGAIIIHAFTGKFLEMGAFENPYKYPRNEAEVNQKAANAQPGKTLKNAKLIFKINKITRNRYQPTIDAEYDTPGGASSNRLFISPGAKIKKTRGNVNKYIGG